MINKIWINLPVLFVVVVVSACVSNNRHKKDQQLVAIQYKSNFPFVDSANGKFILSNILDSNCVMIFFKDYAVCKFDNIKIIEQTGSRYSEQKNSQYFVFRANDKKGFLYDSKMKVILEKKSIDSFLNRKIFFNAHFEINVNDSLVETKKDRNIVVVKYSPKIKFDESYPDSSIYYFDNNFQDCNYPLSYHMDSMWLSKLYHVRFVYNSSFQKKNGQLIPKREFTVEKRKIHLNNEKQIIDFLDRFAKEHP